MKKKILIMSDSPRIYTGFSHIGRKMAMYLHNTGRWDVSYLGWFDDNLNEEQQNFPFPIYKTARDKNGKPVRDDVYAYRSFKPIVERVQPDLLLTIGDSVTGNRRTVIKINDRIETISFNDLYIRYESLAKASSDNKEIIPLTENNINIETLCVHEGKTTWKPIDFISRHMLNGKVVKVRQKYGETVCTHNHSLIDRDMNETKPLDIDGKHMYQVSGIERCSIIDSINIINELEIDGTDTVNIKCAKFDTQLDSNRLKSFCRFLGAYISEGCADYLTVKGKEANHRIRISNSDKEWLECVKNDFNNVFNTDGGSIHYQEGEINGRHVSSYTLTLWGVAPYVIVTELCGRKCAGVHLPNFMFNVRKEYIEEFLDAYNFGDGYSNSPFELECDSTSSRLISDLSIISSILGKKSYISYREEKKSYRLRIKNTHQEQLPVTHTEEIDHNDYVYDLTVRDAANFVDAMGPILLSNTWMAYAPTAFGFENKDNRGFYSIIYPPIDGNPIPTTTTHMAPNNSNVTINWTDTFASYDECIAYCGYGMDEINRSAGKKICNKYIHFGVDTNIYKKLEYDERVRIKKDIFGLKENDFLIITVARNQPRKLYPTMMEAISKFISQNEKGRKIYWYPHAPLTDPTGWNLTDLASKFGLSYRTLKSGNVPGKRIIFDDSLGVGKGPTDEMLNLYYNAADLGLFIYSSEGWGMPPHECMATGTPTIMTHYSAPVDWAEGKTCWVEPFSVFPEPRSNFMRAQVRADDVQKALIKMYNDKDYRSEIGRAGYKFAQTTDWNNNILPEWETHLYNTPVKEIAVKREVLWLKDADIISLHSVTTQPKVSIIIPTFNGGKMFAGCIDSIRSSGYENYELIVVDNGTWNKDNKLYIKQLEDQNVKVLKWNTKYSPSKVLNMAAKEATGEYLLFLDNDTQVNKSSIEGMVSCFINDQKCGASSVRLVDPKTNNFTLGALYDGRLGYNTSKYGRKGNGEYVVVDALTNSCMMVKTSQFNEMGCFDEQYDMYYEDFDFCYRINTLGLSCLCNVKEQIIHIGGATNRFVSKAVFVNDHNKMIKKFWSEYIPSPYVNTGKQKERVGIIKLLTMGDVILTTPLHPLIREKHKDAHIIMYAAKEYADLFVGNPYIDELKVVGPLKREMFGANWGMLAYDAITFNIINHESLDTIYEMNQLDMNFEYRRTGVSMTQGYADMFGLGKLPNEKYIVHLDDHNLATAEKLDVSFPGNGPLIVMHTTAGWSAKETEPSVFASLAELLFNKFKARIYIVGGPNERLESSYVRNIGGLITLRDIIALQKRCSLFIGQDSGPAHLGKCANCKLLVLFGCTNPKVVNFEGVDNYIALQSPYAGIVNCGFGTCIIEEAAKKDGKEYIPCMKRLSVEDVFIAASELLESKSTIQEYRKGRNKCEINYSDWEWRSSVIDANDIPEMCTYGSDL